MFRSGLQTPTGIGGSIKRLGRGCKPRPALVAMHQTFGAGLQTPTGIGFFGKQLKAGLQTPPRM